MRLRHSLFSSVLVSTLAFSAAACSDDEKKEEGGLGSKCSLKEQECGPGLECTEGDDGNVCTIVPGLACDPDDEKHENSGCGATAECTEQEDGKHICTYRVGEICDPEFDNGGCPATAVCVGEKLVSEDAGGAGAAGASGSSEDVEMRCLLAEGSECKPADELCAPEFTCAEMEAGGNKCFHPVTLRGAVYDTSDGSAIEGAHVIAIDDEGVAVTDVAESGEDGGYLLEIPIPREEDGTPVEENVTLDAAAQEYQAFPSGIRVALPINTSEVEHEERAYVIDNTLTEVGLIPLEPGTRTMVSGMVGGSGDGGVSLGGVLVVVSGEGGAFSGITDKSGSYTVFNVPPGSYEVNGYAADLQLGSATIEVADDPLVEVELAQLSTATTTLSGSVQIVNAAGGSVTSVILVVESTFNPDAATGEVPRGLRAPPSGPPNVSGEFTIEGVPDGRYVVLAAYENDDLVRDPDTNIAGTDFVSVEIDSDVETATVLDESFKVTAALEVFAPGADRPEAVEQAPLLRWADDSSEDWYEVRVFDALGNEVWSALDVPGVSGDAEASVLYEGPLEPGMYYQFRATSWRQPGGRDAAPISSTEDLRGVFYVPGE